MTRIKFLTTLDGWTRSQVRELQLTLGKMESGFGLQYSKQIIGFDVGFVLRPLDFRQFILVRLLGQLGQPVVQHGIGLQLGELAGLFGGKQRKERGRATMERDPKFKAD